MTSSLSKLPQAREIDVVPVAVPVLINPAEEGVEYACRVLRVDPVLHVPFNLGYGIVHLHVNNENRIALLASRSRYTAAGELAAQIAPWTEKN